MRAMKKQIRDITKLVKVIWSEHNEEKLQMIISEYISSDSSAVFVHLQGNEIVGTSLCCLRYDYVEGCETSPVGYLEGVVVKEEYRKKGIAKLLVSECEMWSKEKGCSEFASDCELENSASLNFHLNSGFEEQNRIICFKKKI